MASTIIFKIKETEAELKALMKKQIPFLAQRVRVILECKKYEATGISKNELAAAAGVNHNSANTWRKLYVQGGIKALLIHKKTGYKPGSFTAEEKSAIAAKLNDATNAVRGYVELRQWIKDELGKDIKYKTTYGFVKRNFGSKIKVARKSHIKKDVNAVASFKKTSIRSAKPSLPKNKKTIKK